MYSIFVLTWLGFTCNQKYSLIQASFTSISLLIWPRFAENPTHSFSGRAVRSRCPSIFWDQKLHPQCQSSEPKNRAVNRQPSRGWDTDGCGRSRAEFITRERKPFLANEEAHRSMTAAQLWDSWKAKGTNQSGKSSSGLLLLRAHLHSLCPQGAFNPVELGQKGIFKSLLALFPDCRQNYLLYSIERLFLPEHWARSLLHKTMRAQICVCAWTYICRYLDMNTSHRIRTYKILTW